MKLNRLVGRKKKGTHRIVCHFNLNDICTSDIFSRKRLLGIRLLKTNSSEYCFKQHRELSFTLFGIQQLLGYFEALKSTSVRETSRVVVRLSLVEVVKQVSASWIACGVLFVANKCCLFSTHHCILLLPTCVWHERTKN